MGNDRASTVGGVVPVITTLCTALQLNIVLTAILVTNGGKITLFRFVQADKFELTNVVTFMKLTSSSNDLIAVLPLNRVPMESHRDSIQK